MDHSLRCRGSRNVFKRGKLLVEFGEGLLEHLAMLGPAGGLQLGGEAFAGEQKAFTLAIDLLFGRRQGRTRILALVKRVSLLLLDRLTLPTACHCGIIFRFS